MAKMKNFNKMVILGTGDRDESGDVRITPTAQQRIHGAIAEAARYDIPLSSKTPFIIFTGGYCPSLFNDRPPTSEAVKMANYALRIYGRDGLTASAFRLEEESTSTKENIANSFAMYPEFFEETIGGERNIAIVSHEAHVARAAAYATESWGCPADAIVQVAIRDSIKSIPDLSMYRNTGEQLRVAGDE